MNYLSNTTSLIKRNYFIIILNILGIVFYFNFWVDVPLYSSGDSINYVELSNQINNGFDANHYLKNTDLFRTLGYPFILSILNFYENPKLLFFIQLISHFFSATIVFFLLKRYYSSKLLTIIFFIYMILPIYVQHTAYILTESFSQLFLILGLLFFTKYIERTKFQSFMFLSFSVISFSIAALIRPTFQLLPIGLLFLTILFFVVEKKHKYIYDSVIILFSATLVLGSYSYYNKSNFNFTGISPSLGAYLSIKTTKIIEEIPIEYSDIKEVLIEQRNLDLVKPNSSHTGKMYIWKAIPTLKKKLNLNFVELSKKLKDINYHLIKNNPLDYMLDVFESSIGFWFPNVSAIVFFESMLLKIIFHVLHFIIIGVYFFSFIFLFYSIMIFYVIDRNRLITFLNNNKSKIITIIFSNYIIAYTFLVSIFSEAGNPRHRIPTDLIILFCVFITIKISHSLLPTKDTYYKS